MSPRRCPRCRSTRVARLLYGYLTVPDERMQRDIDAGRVRLGGCTVTDRSPERVCLACGWELVEEYATPS